MANFKSIGKLPVFKGPEEFFRSNNGFLLSDVFGGPAAANHIAKTYEAREDDIIVASFPKTGTTWLQELVYLIGTDLDFESAKSVNLTHRFPFIEYVRQPQCTDVSKLPSPRFIKTHYPYSLLPKSMINKKCKIFVPFRNPKDTVVSYYYFSKMTKEFDFTEELSSFVDYFVSDNVFYAPYWKYVLEFWEKRHDENIFLVSYEDMSRDIVSVIHKISSFFGKPQLGENDVARIVDYCSFDNMKNNPKSNPELTMDIFDGKISSFMRKGKVGDWKNHLTEEMNRKMDAYIKKNFSGTGIDFIYE